MRRSHWAVRSLARDLPVTGVQDGKQLEAPMLQVTSSSRPGGVEDVVHRCPKVCMQGGDFQPVCVTVKVAVG
uniref:Uncharacterized protein n=1 Tax=Anguilla anguilla TaxID=7936 RepID=A0A0E9QZM6_ANGAN